MPEHEDATKPRDRGRAHRSMDLLAGASLGALLGLLMGSTTSPVASIVVTGLVALLGGLFGLSDKIVSAFSERAAYRLVSFGLAALLVTPIALWVRVHEVLMPSVAQQKQLLIDIGIEDKREQTDMLRYLRFGLLPEKFVATRKGDQIAMAIQSTLYAAPAEFCNSLLELHLDKNTPLADFDRLFLTWKQSLGRTGEVVRALKSESEQKAAFASAYTYLCSK